MSKVESDGICSQEHSIYRTRRFSQIAENFGWSIGGYALAYSVEGGPGVVYLALSMIVAAMISSGIVFHGGVVLHASLIRWSLVCRGISFTIMLLGGFYDSIWLVAFGGFMSGLFVGTFWPTYYRIQSICGLSFSKWNLRDKLAGALIVVLSGLVIDMLGHIHVLVVSLIAILGSYWFSRNLNGDGECGAASEYSSVRADIGAICSLPSLIAMAEGAFNWMTNLSRLLVILTGLVTWGGVSSSVGLGLLLATTASIGATISWGLGAFPNRKVNRSFQLVVSGLSLSLLACILLSNKSGWIYGMIVLSVGSSMIFPVLKDHVDAQIESNGLAGRGLREYSRNIGRFLGTLIIAGIWYLSPVLFLLAIPIVVSILVIGILYLESSEYSIILYRRSSMKKEVRN